MATHDLTTKLVPFLDRHLVYPLLIFIESKKIYNAKDMLQAKFDLLSKTHAIDYCIDFWKQLNASDAVPESMLERRSLILSKMEDLQLHAPKLYHLMHDERELVERLKAEKQFTMANLEEKYEITSEQVEWFYVYAKFQYECGNYGGAAELLGTYLQLTKNPALEYNAMWGKLAADILTPDWDAAMADLVPLRTLLESKQMERQMPPLQLLQQRTWLIHWSLFVFFNHPEGRNGMIDLFFHKDYLNAIQTTCPHILRYLATAVITNKKRRAVLKDLVKVIEQEGNEYRDPITEFIECLYVNFDFEGAQDKLRACQEVISNDYFLCATSAEFLENARLFIFETYCRIHQTISIKMLAQRLGMDEAEAERWIVNLIREVRLDAKINSQEGTVIMGTQTPSVYQQIIDKTKGLSFRSSNLASGVEQRRAYQRNEASGGGRGRGGMRGGRGGRGGYQRGSFPRSGGRGGFGGMKRGEERTPIA